MKTETSRKRKIGIAFGGGGAKGMVHIGAIKAFEEYGLDFDYVAGTSVGSIIGAAYAYGLKWEDMYDVVRGLKTKDIVTSKFFLVPSKSDGIQEVMRSTLGDITFADLKKPFSAIAVDLKTTKEVCISSGNLAKSVAASCCVPGVFAPVELGDYLLVDGGLQNNIPTNIPRIFGCDYSIGVDCNSTRAYGTDSPKMLDVITCSLRILMQANSVKGYTNSDITVACDTKKYKATQLESIEELIDLGYQNTIDAMPQIKKIFSGKAPKTANKDFGAREIIFI